jgi:tetrahydromethanopterin S-methyltransferase subunit C
LILLALVAIIAGGAIATTAYAYYGRVGQKSVVLPSGCAKSQGGYLIVAAYNGFNDSADQGVPANNWPVISVLTGANVTIVVCNADTQPHGFQIYHYYNSRTNILAPGEVMKVSFIANQAGQFQIFCSIVCSVHWAMISGELAVR